MKRILLTSTALVAFAGAAAADVSLSGTAEFSYNTIDGYASDTEITAAASAALDNGYTASVSFTIDPEATADEITGGDISVSSDTASITYHVDNLGAGAALIGDPLSMMTENDVTFDTDGKDNADSTISGSFMAGGATIRASLDGASDYQVGVSTDLGGTTLDAGFDSDGSVFGIQLGGDAGAVAYNLAFDSDNNYGLGVSTTAGGADVSLDFGDLGWEVSATMPLGAAEVTATVTDTVATAGTGWSLGTGTSLEGVDLDFTLTQAEGAAATTWKMSAAYTAGDIGVDFSTTGAAWTVEADYDMGNGVTAGAGTDGTEQYVTVDYDLGGGANLSLDYASADDAVDADLELIEGTTVSVSFSF